VATRLGRYLLQELFGWKGWLGAAGATVLTVGAPLGLLLSSEPGSWMRYWTLFGASNQLLAALTLLAVTVWLRRTGRRSAFTAVPMVFVLVTTLAALGKLAIANFRASHGGDVAFINAFAATALIALALYLLAAALAAARRPRPVAVRPAPNP
jgi:carbon starvation protein